MDLAQLVEWAFYGIVGYCALHVANSVSDLNVKIAVVIQQLTEHERRIENLEGDKDV